MVHRAQVVWEHHGACSTPNWLWVADVTTLGSPPQNFCHSLEVRWPHSYTAPSLLTNCARPRPSLLEASSHIFVLDKPLRKLRAGCVYFDSKCVYVVSTQWYHNALECIPARLLHFAITTWHCFHNILPPSS